MLRVLADNAKMSLAADHLAFCTHLFYSGSYFHMIDIVLVIFENFY